MTPNLHAVNLDIKLADIASSGAFEAGVLQRVKTGYLLRFCAICSATLVTVSMWSMIAIGFFNSIMFLSIFALDVAELGPLPASGSGLINMAIVGGAIIPVIQGAMADSVGIYHAFILPVICYLYIVFYGLRGSKAKQRTLRKPLRCL